MIMLSYEDIIAKAEEFIKFGKDIHFLVRGYLAEDIVFYLDGETDYTQYMECGHEDEYIIDEYYNNKMYWVDIAPKEGLYYVQEAVYQPQGILAQNDEDDIVYYQKNNILSKENKKRVLGNIFEFTYDEDIEDEYDTEDDFNELFEEVMSSIEKRLERAIEKCEEDEDCDCNECLAERIEHLYEIIDEMENRLDKLESKTYGSQEVKLQKNEQVLNGKMTDVTELLLKYLREYC